MRITSKVTNALVTKPLQTLSSSKGMEKFRKAFIKDSPKFQAGVAVFSLVAKDILGGYLYVTQSLKNEKIPKEKRAFVASVDLANSILMVSTQILAFFTIANSKVQKKITDKICGKIFDRPVKKAYKTMMMSKDKYKDLPARVFYENYEALQKSCRSAVSVFSSLIATTIIAKRMIVPFISTPMADFVKNKLIAPERGNKVNKAFIQSECMPKKKSTQQQQPSQPSASSRAVLEIMNKKKG